MASTTEEKELVISIPQEVYDDMMKRLAKITDQGYAGGDLSALEPSAV